MAVNIYEMTDTWNNAGTTFTAIEMNVTDTASASGSLLMDLQVGGTSQFSVKKDGKVSLPSGTSASPSLRFGSFETGFYEASGGTLAFVSGGGDEGVRFEVGLGVGMKSGAQIWWSSNSNVGAYSSRDLVLARDAANTFAQRNATNAQTFNLYNTYTDGSNYERGFLKWSSNVLEIGTEAAGTGTKRNIVLDGANRAAHIADVSTGTDTAYETAINAIIAALESHGIAATS